jgi:hypothetical protein
MKFLKNILQVAATICVLALLALPARAQVGFDLWGPVRDVALTNGGSTLINATSGTYVTNQAILTRNFNGIAVADYFVCTNSGTNTFSILPQVSPDTTNWYSLSNYSLGVWLSATNTNNYYASASLITTNWYNLPGTPTSPTAYSSGFNTSYLTYAPFTNSGTISNTGSTQVGIAWSIADGYAYYRTIFYVTGTNSVGGTLHARLRGN